MTGGGGVTGLGTLVAVAGGLAAAAAMMKFAWLSAIKLAALEYPHRFLPVVSGLVRVV